MNAPEALRPNSRSPKAENKQTETVNPARLVLVLNPYRVKGLTLESRNSDPLPKDSNTL